MSDEQTHLLQAILDAVKEQTAFTNQYRDEAMAVQHTVLDRQKSISKRISRLALIFMLAMVGCVVAYVMAK